MTEEEKIERLVRDLHQALSWTGGKPADWPAFRRHFAPCAYLFSSGRPLVPLSVEDFIARMDAQRSSGALMSYEESVEDVRVHAFGNMAVTHITSVGHINKQDHVRTIGAILLAKDLGKWLVVSMAWDKDSKEQNNVTSLGCP
jgi:hypothetical protein